MALAVAAGAHAFFWPRYHKFGPRSPKRPESATKQNLPPPPPPPQELAAGDHQVRPRGVVQLGAPGIPEGMPEALQRGFAGKVQEELVA